MKRIATDSPNKTTDELKNYAYCWFAGLAVSNLALTLIAIATIMNGLPGMAALVLCIQIFIPGLAFTKWLEVGYLWRGAKFDGSNPRMENGVALPGFLTMVLAVGIGWLLVITGLPFQPPT